MRIKECTCPKCGRNDFDYEGVGFDMGHHTGSNTYDVEYIVLCDCGCTFVYTERFNLKETLIEKLHD